MTSRRRRQSADPLTALLAREAPADDQPGWRERWRARFGRWAVPEVVAGALIAAGWAAAAAVTMSGSPLLALVAVAVTLWMHLGAVESGNHTLAWMTTGLLVLFGIVTLASLDREVGPLAYTAASTTALAHSDLIRLSYARRRRAAVDPGLYPAVALGVVLAGLVGGAGVMAAGALSGTADRNWLWMPVTVGALVVVAVALTVLPVRRAPPSRRERWRPGDRIPPPPAGDGATDGPTVGAGEPGR